MLCTNQAAGGPIHCEAFPFLTSLLPHISACREAWYLEIGSGHHWLALRVPDDAFFVTGNQGRFKASQPQP